MNQKAGLFQRVGTWFSHISGITRSIRFRLALWFALVLTAVIIVFSLFVYYRQAQDVRNRAAAQLSYRLGELNVAFLRAARNQAESEWLQIPRRSDPNPFVLDETEVLILSDPEGTPAGFWGSLDSDQAGKIAWQVSELAKIQNSPRFYTDDLKPAVSNESSRVLYIFSPSPIISGNHLVGFLVLGQPVDPDGQLPKLVWTLFLAGLFTLLVALAGGYWLADRALWPVKVITRTAQEISETDLSRRLNLQTRDELGELASTFDRMLDRLQAAFTRQRQFTADASHELRTPLTIIGLETSRALEASRSVEEYRQALQVIHSENEFMTRLVGELLTLARMDAGQVTLKTEPLDLSEIALDVLERYEPLAAQKCIQLQAGELPELPVIGDRQYLLQMIGNLVDNAIKYNYPGDKHWVRIETGTNPDSGQPAAWVRVTDNGPGIDPEHLPHLFDRFFRVDRARSHNPGENDEDNIPGSGLGLSIVQWIARIHNGQISVQSEPGQGSSFEVWLPLHNP